MSSFGLERVSSGPAESRRSRCASMGAQEALVALPHAAADALCRALR